MAEQTAPFVSNRMCFFYKTAYFNSTSPLAIMLTKTSILETHTMVSSNKMFLYGNFQLKAALEKIEIFLYVL